MTNCTETLCSSYTLRGRIVDWKWPHALPPSQNVLWGARTPPPAARVGGRTVDSIVGTVNVLTQRQPPAPSISSFLRTFDGMSRRRGYRSRRWRWRGCSGPDGSAARRSPFEPRSFRCALAPTFSEGVHAECCRGLFVCL